MSVDAVESRKPAHDQAVSRAVIDIGSNSVRLVVFSGPLRAPMAICNEKALCGLGRTLGPAGELDPMAVDDALATLARYKELLRAYDEPETFVIATAAVRDAKNGFAFVEAVHALGFDLKVISGAEEAALAALGVAMVEPHAQGLAGDMGGGSLELVALENDDIGEKVSIPIGPLSVMRRAGDDMKAAAEIIKTELSKIDFISDGRYRTLYAVGGAWRSVARIHMNLKHYPLAVLNHYEMSAASAIEVCQLIARQSRQSLEEIPGISRKRIDTLPYAALALIALLKRMKAERMVVSAGGVREGVLYRELSRSERQVDPLLAACQFFSKRFSPNPAFGEAAYDVVSPLITGDCGVDARIVRAACELTDVAAFFHPDLRGRQAFDTALSAPFMAVNHAERVWIALALFTRYRGRNAVMPNEQAISLLSWEQQQSAAQLGLALRLVATIAPKSPDLLADIRLYRATSGVEMSAPASKERLFGETAVKRMNALAAAFETTGAFVFT